MTKEKKKIEKQKKSKGVKFGLKQKLLVYFLLVALVPLIGITIFTSISLNTSYESDRLIQLEATAMNKDGQITSWFAERKGDVDFMTETEIQENAAIAGNYSNPGKLVAQGNIESTMDAMIKAYGCYNEMYVLNKSGIVVAQSSKEGWLLGHDVDDDQSTGDYFTECDDNSLNEEFTYLSIFRWSSSGDYVQITVSSVIHNDSVYVGVLVFYIDFLALTTMMQETMGLGESGETYLLSSTGLWISESKFDYYTTETGTVDTIEDTVLNVETKVTTDGVVECLAAADTEISINKPTNLDYRGIPVMGSYHYLLINDAGTPWILVAEMDVEEALMVPTTLMTTSIWIMVVIAGVVAAIAYIIARRIANPIVMLSGGAAKIADGDLSSAGKEFNSKKSDEIGELTRSFSVMYGNLKQIIADSQKASLGVSNMAAELSASSSEVNAASEEISASSQEVAQSTSEQVQSLVEINRMAVEISTLSDDVMLSTKDINKIMDIVTNISGQTNLLALNASIEAGRAGEAGRGFAVVADEVRKLAEESQRAVGDTGEKIESITNKIQNTVNLIAKITHDIENTTTASEENSKSIEGISASSEEQTASMEEISGTAHSLGDLAESLKDSLDKFRLTIDEEEKSEQKINEEEIQKLSEIKIK